MLLVHAGLEGFPQRPGGVRPTVEGAQLDWAGTQPHMSGELPGGGGWPCWVTCGLTEPGGTARTAGKLLMSRSLVAPGGTPASPLYK